MISKILRFDMGKEKYRENYCAVQAYESGLLFTKKPKQGGLEGVLKG
jgi:hypothetical protein